jgi:carbon monoxide dehydrogenase subunit G
MITVERTFEVDKPADVVVEYLKDFAHAEQWDPGTKSCTQESAGPVAVGTTWHNVSEIKGRETELTYELVRLEPGHLTFVGENKTATSTDDIRVTGSGTGSTITYRAEIEFHGIAKVAGPFLQGEFDSLGDETRDSLTAVIARLP